MDFIKVTAANSVGPFYVKVTEEDATVVQPGVGAITLDSDAIMKLMDFRRSFDYATVIQRRAAQGASINTDVLEYNILNGSGDEEEASTELDIVKFLFSRTTDTPERKLEKISTVDGTKTGELTIPWEVCEVLFRQMEANGFVSSRMVIAKIIKTDKLPNETAARDDVVYVFEKKNYHLNADEDELTELTGTFKQVKKLPEFEATAKADVLYQLSTAYEDKDLGVKFEKGIYTYDASTNKMNLQDLKISDVAALPETGEANVLYRLTKANEEVPEQTKGSVWKFADNAFAKETREIVKVSKLPVYELAVDKVYYIVNGTLMKQADTTKKVYKTLGNLLQVKELPDVSTIQLAGDVVYVLTKQQVAADGTTRARGSKWVFDVNAKEFKAFTEGETTIVSGGGQNPSNTPAPGPEISG